MYFFKKIKAVLLEGGEQNLIDVFLRKSGRLENEY